MPTAKKEESAGVIPFRERFLKLQESLHAPKSNNNSFGHYKYRSLEDVCEAVKPLANKWGINICLDIRESNLQAERPEITAWAEAIDALVELPENYENNPNYCIIARQPAIVDLSKKGMSSEQAVGSASSYAKKYALSSLLLIDDTKDADTDEYRQEVESKAKEQAKQEKPQTITATEAKALENMMDEAQRKYVIDHFGAFTNLTKEAYTKFVNQIKAHEASSKAQ